MDVMQDIATSQAALIAKLEQDLQNSMENGSLILPIP